MPVVLAQQPCEKSLRRFARTMQILDLDVFVHPSQEGHALAPTPEDDRSGTSA